MKIATCWKKLGKKFGRLKLLYFLCSVKLIIKLVKHQITNVIIGETNRINRLYNNVSIRIERNWEYNRSRFSIYRCSINGWRNRGLKLRRSALKYYKLPAIQKAIRRWQRFWRVLAKNKGVALRVYVGIQNKEGNHPVLSDRP